MNEDKPRNKNNEQSQPCLHDNNKPLVELFMLLFEWDIKDVKRREKESEKVQDEVQSKNYKI